MNFIHPVLHEYLFTLPNYRFGFPTGHALLRNRIFPKGSLIICLKWLNDERGDVLIESLAHAENCLSHQMM